MSTLTMPSQHNHQFGYRRELSWQDTRSEQSSRPRNDHERVALPSIRQAFPELQLQIQESSPTGTISPTTSPTGGPFTGNLTPPDYIHSPNRIKRRRLSAGEDGDVERAGQIPRLYAGPQPVHSRQQSPASTAPRLSSDTWEGPRRASPFVGSSGLPSIRSPIRTEVQERMEPRPTLPSLPLLNFERGPGEMQRVRSRSGDDYAAEPLNRSSVGPSSSHGIEPVAIGYREAPTSYGYGYHHPSRGQSLSMGSIHPLDRTPFSAGGYGGHQFQDAFIRMGEFGSSGNGDSKQRKRRGNLPKETTDKLRAWFVAHLNHPYPTEDEKQELMRQTGLQMNQISNWFINARRRQLPTMMKDAHAATDAMTGGRGSAPSTDGRIIPSAERLEFDHEGKTSSDGEGSNYGDVTLETIKRRRVASMKRGSI